nr:SDR family oxidoreductase [Sphingomonas sp. CDS-1]
MSKEKGGALVLGGTGGLGSAIVRRLATDWEHVDFTYRSNEAKAEALIGELAGEQAGAGDVAAHRLDIADEQALAEVVRSAHARSGGLRAVVFSSGVHIPQIHVSKLQPDQWHEVVQAELMGFIALVRQVLPVLRETRGCIVNIGSVAPHWFVVGDALSAVPKAGSETLCRAVAKEEGRFGVRANTVAPGIMEVGIGGKLMGEIYSDAIWEQSKKSTPLRRFGTGEDVAGITAFLCSGEASFITGQTIIADGGLSL